MEEGELEMWRVFGRAIAVVIALGWAGMAAAVGTLYDCTITKGGEAGTWISPRVALILRDGQSPMIVDEVTLHFKGGPVAASVKKKGAELRFRWRVTGATDSKQNRASFNYRAFLDTRNNRVKVIAEPRDYHSRFTGTGSCKQHQNITPRKLQKLLRRS